MLCHPNLFYKEDIPFSCHNLHYVWNIFTNNLYGYVSHNQIYNGLNLRLLLSCRSKRNMFHRQPMHVVELLFCLFLHLLLLKLTNSFKVLVVDVGLALNVLGLDRKRVKDLDSLHERQVLYLQHDLVHLKHFYIITL